MKVVLFGASGMVGQGALRECLLDPEVSEVLAVVRRPLEEKPRGVDTAKLRELVHADMFDFEPVAERLRGYDACLFTLGTSAAGMKEADYRRVTYDLTMAAARVLARESPGLVFEYVSGQGTDSSERGRSMWARVKGATENALLGLGFGAAFMLRPGVIQPRHGIKSKTRLYRAAYIALTPFFPLLKAVAGSHITNTEDLGRVMVHLAKRGKAASDKAILEQRDLTAMAKALRSAAGSR